jgi:hypothetical protein
MRTERRRSKEEEDRPVNRRICLVGVVDDRKQEERMMESRCMLDERTQV